MRPQLGGLEVSGSGALGPALGSDKPAAPQTAARPTRGTLATGVSGPFPLDTDSRKHPMSSTDQGHSTGGEQPVQLRGWDGWRPTCQRVKPDPCLTPYAQN